ncbi:hypothetical protein ABZ540_35070 [Nocardia xishanensis]|uniref:hypothetical protein n=1 Tax=Nocardia xishanensis TaxID=238964 RepID=UPI0033F4FBDD
MTVETTQIVPLDAVRKVILSLTAAEKESMIDCLRHELDPPVNVIEKFHYDGRAYTATVLSNGWVVVFREDSARDLLHPWGRKIILFDLLDPQSALYGGYGFSIA